MYGPRKRLCRDGGPSAVAGDAASTSAIPYVRVAHAARRGPRPGRMRLPPILPQYVDLRDSRCVCEYCGAFFWFFERSMKLSTRNHLRYSRCCRSGEVVLPYPSTFPPEYMSLFRNNSFLRDIRAYNSMFSMTSFGATVDDELNDGRGPYVFKVSGQISHRIGSLCPDAVKGPRFLQLYLFDTTNKVQNTLKSFKNPQKNLLDEGVVRFLVSFSVRITNTYGRLRLQNSLQMR